MNPTEGAAVKSKNPKIRKSLAFNVANVVIGNGDTVVIAYKTRTIRAVTGENVMLDVLNPWSPPLPKLPGKVSVPSVNHEPFCPAVVSGDR